MRENDLLWNCFVILYQFWKTTKIWNSLISDWKTTTKRKWLNQILQRIKSKKFIKINGNKGWKLTNHSENDMKKKISIHEFVCNVQQAKQELHQSLFHSLLLSQEKFAKTKLVFAIVDRLSHNLQSLQPACKNRAQYLRWKASSFQISNQRNLVFQFFEILEKKQKDWGMSGLFVHTNCGAYSKKWKYYSKNFIRQIRQAFFSVCGHDMKLKLFHLAPSLSQWRIISCSRWRAWITDWGSCGFEDLN